MSGSRALTLLAGEDEVRSQQQPVVAKRLHVVANLFKKKKKKFNPPGAVFKKKGAGPGCLVLTAPCRNLSRSLCLPLGSVAASPGLRYGSKSRCVAALSPVSSTCTE